jgi:hypothetical protein
MPVYTLECPDCRHTFQGLQLGPLRSAQTWVCSQCGGDRATPKGDCEPVVHPWEDEHANGCPCCGL